MSFKKWRTVTIDQSPIEIIDGDRGHNYPKQEEFYENEYCLFLNTSNVTPQGFNFEKTSFVTKEKDQVLRKGKLKRDDIVLTTRGTVGNVAYYDENVLYDNIRINSGMVIFRNSKPGEISSQYFYQFLRSALFRSQVESHSSGSAQPQLPIKDLKSIELPLPPLPTQSRIAAILSAFDDKIELNRQTNATLEAISQAIFKEWFVDFCFPGNTGEMEDSRLGLIPKGWKVGKIKNFTKTIQYGLTQSASGEKVGPRFLRITDIQNGRINWDSVPYCPVDDKNWKKYRIEDYDIFIARTGASTGENVLVVNPPQAVFASYLIRIQFAQPELSVFIGKLLRSRQYFEFIDSIKSGSAQPNANAQQLTDFDIVLPSSDLLQTYYQNVVQIEELKAGNETQSANLAQIRDTLLPKLMSGEIEV